jgi:DNA-directed RNA polymerase specialized sigma subunit
MWYAKKSIGRLLIELSLAKSAYKQAAEDCPVTYDYSKVRTKRQRSGLSPVEYSAVLLVDQYRAEVESIERRLASERAKAEEIETALKNAGLSKREEEYIRVRYFENRTVEATAQRLFCSPATCGRLRESVLFKLEHIGEDCQEA